MIRKLPSGQYRLYSRKISPKTGKRRNLGTFKTRLETQRHERAVQYFKRLSRKRWRSRSSCKAASASAWTSSGSTWTKRRRQTSRVRPRFARLTCGAALGAHTARSRGLRAALAACDEHDFAAADFSDRHG